MNKLQKRILLITAGIIAAMIIFPPYAVFNYKHIVIMSGYGLIFDLPSYLNLPASVNVATLLAQIVGVLVVGVLVYFAFRDEQQIESK